MALVEEFRRDGTGRRYRRELEYEYLPEVIALLEDPARQRAMELAGERGTPALAGVVSDIEALPSVKRYLAEHSVGKTARFRQAVGVAVKVVMESRGWEKTDTQGAVAGAEWFRKAERYRRRDDQEAERLRRGRAQLEALGTDDERRDTRAELLDALSATRASEGRPF